MGKYKSGDIVTGCVTGIEKYGVFVSLDDYYSGLIHISEISDGFVRNIHDYVKIGETINAKVIEENEDYAYTFYGELRVDYKFRPRAITAKLKRFWLKYPDGMITSHYTNSLAAAFVCFREEVNRDKKNEREISLYCGVYRNE